MQCSARIIHLHTHRPYSDQGLAPYVCNAQPASYIYTHTQALQWPRPGPVCMQCSARIIHLHTHTGLTVTKAWPRMYAMLSPHHTSTHTHRPYSDQGLAPYVCNAQPASYIYTHTQALQWPRPGPVCMQCSARIIHLHTHTGLTVTKTWPRMYAMLSPHHTSTHTHRPYSDQDLAPYVCNAQPASYIYTHTQTLQWPRPGPVCMQCSARIIHLHTHTGLTVTKAWPRMYAMLSPHHTSTHTHRPYSDQGLAPYVCNAQPASYIYTHTQALQWPRPGPVCMQCSARIIHLHTHTDAACSAPIMQTSHSGEALAVLLLSCSSLLLAEMLSSWECGQ